MVMPIGPLMTGHRLIERMIILMEKELEKIKKEKRANFKFIETAVDFIRTYADRLHHGKEEDILFRVLEAKELEEQHRKTMEELKEEHRWGRIKVKELVFIPIMNYFNQSEQESMLDEEREFDRNFIHEIYKKKVNELE